MAYSRAKEKEEIKLKHTHNWVKKNEFEFYCSNFYEKILCIAIKIGPDEYQRRIDEWNNYYNLAQNSQTKRDYDEMRQAYKDKNKEKMAEIMQRVNTRAKRSNRENEWGDKDIEFNQSEYMAIPDFPDPFDPSFPYVVEQIYKKSQQAQVDIVCPT